MGGEFSYVVNFYDKYENEFFDVIHFEEVADVVQVGGLPDGCNPLPSMPKGIKEGTTAYIDNAVIVCGGSVGASEQEECYTLSSSLAT